MENVQQCGVPVQVNGVLKSVTELAESLLWTSEVDPRALLSPVISLVEEDFVATERTPELKIEFRKLAEMQEQEFQNGLLREQLFDVKWAQARDLSSSNSSMSGPFFKPAQTVGEAVVCHLSAKPDATSLAAPMDLEIKSDKGSRRLAAVDWEVLDQAVERVVMRLRMAGFLSYAVAFAVTGRSAWCVVGERRLETRKEFRQLYVCHVAHSDVSLLWGAVTRSVTRDPCAFVTADGPLILRSLRAAGLEPWACRVKWLATSMSSIYGVTVPQDYKLGTTRCRGVDCRLTSVTFAVKVVRGECVGLFAREVFALEKLAKASLASNFYALGHFPDKTRTDQGMSPFKNALCFGRARFFRELGAVFLLSSAHTLTLFLVKA